MSFWNEYLKNPPLEVEFSTSWDIDPEAFHCVRWVGYGGDHHETFEIDRLWNFGSSGLRGMGAMPPKMGFPKYGGETLCGLKIESGQKMFGPRWRSIEPAGFPYESPDENNLRAVLTDLNGITCMVCRKKLMYGIARLIEDLTFIRSKLVGDWAGEDYVSREPIIHGKCVISVETRGGRYAEAYKHRCKTAAESIYPQLVDDAKEPERITCPECLSNLAEGVLAYGDAPC